MSMRGPNAWAVAAFAAVLGAVIGGAAAAIEASLRPWRIGEFSGASLAAAAKDGPRADVPETQLAFGTIGSGAERSYEFTIGNTGSSALVLTRGASSCSCTVSDFENSEGGDSAARKEVAPGESTKVRVKWRGKGSGGPFRQQVTVFTNDPRRPEIAFVIEGTVVPTWKAEPASIVFSKMSPSGGENATALIFTFGKEPPRIGELSLADPGFSQFFSLSSAPLEAAEIAAETGATGGFLLKVEVRPGLPIGPFRQSIGMKFGIPEEVAAEIPLEGNVAGDLALAGLGWDSSQQALLLGTVSGKTGAHARLFLTVKGGHRDAVRPTVREVVPPAVEVEVGTAKAVGSGDVMRIPISIKIPPGSPPGNHRCSQQAPGIRIVLDTGHPATPTLTIPVCVIIEP